MKKLEKSDVCAVVAGLLSIAAYLQYNWKNLSGTTQPNLSSWSVWAFITILNFTSYKKLTGDWVKSILPTLNAALCITTVVVMTKSGSFRNLNVNDQICLSLGLLAGLCWWVFQKKDFAEALVQVVLEVAIVIGFIPTILGVTKNSSSEPWHSWLLWSGSFAAQYCVVRLREGSWIEYLYPVNMFGFHVAVFLLATKPPSK